MYKRDGRRTCSFKIQFIFSWLCVCVCVVLLLPQLARVSAANTINEPSRCLVQARNCYENINFQNELNARRFFPWFSFARTATSSAHTHTHIKHVMRTTDRKPGDTNSKIIANILALNSIEYFILFVQMGWLLLCDSDERESICHARSVSIWSHNSHALGPTIRTSHTHSTNSIEKYYSRDF